MSPHLDIAVQLTLGAGQGITRVRGWISGELIVAG
jgi:hypothetical protein